MGVVATKIFANKTNDCIIAFIREKRAYYRLLVSWSIPLRNILLVYTSNSVGWTIIQFRANVGLIFSLDTHAKILGSGSRYVIPLDYRSKVDMYEKNIVVWIVKICAFILVKPKAVENLTFWLKIDYVAALFRISQFVFFDGSVSSENRVYCTIINFR